MFFRLYERALENSFEREIEADFDTICNAPVLRTPSPMEKQAANLYTRKIFSKFQEELVDTFAYIANRIEGDGAISTYRVTNYEDDQKAYSVMFNYPELRANCSCQMFEYSGILCRHVLTVFAVTNVLKLPSHYILKRWTRNAKSGSGSDDHAGESLTSRYNTLCREAIRYAEEGAITVETYNVATNALREDTTPCLWPRQDEVSRRFNLNDAGGPAQSVSDLNFPRMAPVSLHRDDGPPENLVVLPCLKSMTWVMENKSSVPGNKVAVINLKLQDYSRSPSAESEVKFQLSRVSLEPMLKSMAYISEQLSTPANKVAVINLKLQDTETTTGESEVKFQVSRETLGAMLRSMAYIREQLSNTGDGQPEPLLKKHRK
ncbi:Protein FAR1-RELATED SEQUENCE like [Quillaja saponaria]|uniref:Protein FAR1-RELATED SEQUENCE like n=1 Tax=Quillaja saponaria TaxID=32244 RepID=A0AAD7LN70_QUISA|nr:Protein FAR1-RELATED SEQUENCE like [Quillaja saponaria]